jgi:hypothetical protein
MVLVGAKVKNYDDLRHLYGTNNGKQELSKYDSRSCIIQVLKTAHFYKGSLFFADTVVS